MCAVRARRCRRDHIGRTGSAATASFPDGGRSLACGTLGAIRPSFLPIVLGVALTLGCAGAPSRRTEAVPDLRVSALVVERLRASGGVSDDEVLALSARLGLRTVAGASGRALVWGAGEVRPLHPERSDWTATDALTTIRSAGVAPTEVLLVRARLDRTSAEGRQEVAGRSGGAGVGTSAEWIDRARIELIHPSTGRVIAWTPSGPKEKARARCSTGCWRMRSRGWRVAGRARPCPRWTRGDSSDRPEEWASRERCDASPSSGSPIPAWGKTRPRG